MAESRAGAVRLVEKTSRLLRPRRRPAPGEQRLDLLGSLKLGEQFSQQRVSPGVVLELGQREASTQSDAPSVFVRRRQVERAREQVVGLLDGERVSRSLGGPQQVSPRGIHVPGFPPVMGEKPAEVGRIRKCLLQEPSDRRVQVPA